MVGLPTVASHAFPPARPSSTPRADPADVGWAARLNGGWHKPAMLTFGAIVLAHWAEHLLQAWQIWGLGWPRPQARGLLGLWIPWLVSSEWLHYGYAVVMGVLFVLLRPGMGGRSRTWWTVALWIQAWHLFEHALLLVQALVGTNLFGQSISLPKVAPVSVLQTVFPRVELHLFYNAVVTVPMALAMIWHTWPPRGESGRVACACARHTRRSLGPRAPAGAA